jgi:hypothetical protein
MHPNIRQGPGLNFVLARMRFRRTASAACSLISGLGIGNCRERYGAIAIFVQRELDRLAGESDCLVLLVLLPRQDTQIGKLDLHLLEENRLPIGCDRRIIGGSRRRDLVRLPQHFGLRSHRSPKLGWRPRWTAYGPAHPK